MCNSRNIKFIIAFLNSLDAGVISDVEFNENNMKTLREAELYAKNNKKGKWSNE